jgi:excisionase family DNA binding protein
MAQPEDDVYTVAELAKRLKVDRKQIYRLIQAGRIPAVRVGRQWRFRKQDVDRWLESQGGRTAVTGSTAARASVEQRPRILVVDDEAGIRELLAKTLALAEYDVDLAGGGAEALERLRRVHYDLVITDLKMPAVDGMTLIRDARRILPQLPIIIITGYSTEASAIEAINLGVNGYLTKPFRVPKVLSAAAKALGE